MAAEHSNSLKVSIAGIKLLAALYFLRPGGGIVICFVEA